LSIEAFARHCLLNGLDELGFLRSKLDDIERYEAMQLRSLRQAAE
jgi:3-isopropylmalate dehydratase small subunit